MFNELTIEETCADLELNCELGEYEKTLLKKYKLIEKQRYCLIKYYWQGCTASKIGKKLVISHCSVSEHINRARKKIAKYYKIDLSDKKNLRKVLMTLRK